MDGPEREAGVIEGFFACFSEQAFGDLFSIFYPKVFRFFRARRLEVEVCEELSQNVLLAVYRSARHVRDTAKFLPWIFRIARNELLQYQRHNRAISRAAVLEPLDDSAQVSNSSPPRDTQEFEDLLLGVEPSDREILCLRFVDGLTYTEIADLLSVPTGTLKWRVARVRAQLAARMQNGVGVKEQL